MIREALCKGSANAMERAMKNRRTWIVLGVMAVASMCVNRAGASANVNPWDGATDVERKVRFIPLELWTGAEWHGGRGLEMIAVDGHYRHNKSAYSIKGPIPWKHPATGQTHVVYQRVNPDSGEPANFRDQRRVDRTWQTLRRTAESRYTHVLRRTQISARILPGR